MKLFSRLALLLVVVLAFAGCTNGDKASSESKKEDKKAEETITVSTPKGDVKIPKEPKRVVDLAYAQEELHILGIKPVIASGSEVGGVAPEYLKAKMPDTKFVEPETVKVEEIMEAKPDLIIVSNDDRNPKIYDMVKDIAPTVALKHDFYTWKDRFPEIANLFGKEKEMKAWMDAYTAKAKKMGDEIKAKTGEQKFASYVTNGKQYRIYGNALLGDVLFSDMGLPLAEGGPDPKADRQVNVVDLEALYKFNPDHIFLGLYGENLDLAKKQLDDMQNSQVWKNLNAVKNGNVYSMDNPTWGLGRYPIGKEMVLEKVRDLVLKK